LNAVVSSAAGKLKITQEDRDYLLSKSQAQLPQSISRLMA